MIVLRQTHKDFFRIYTFTQVENNILVTALHAQLGIYPFEFIKGVMQELRNAIGLGVYGSVHISLTKVYGPMLLALRGYDGCPISRKKNYVTFEWPQMYNTHRDQTLTALYVRGQFSVGRAFETTPSSCCILLGTCSSAIALCRGIVVCLAPSSSGLGASEGLHRRGQVKLDITVYT